MALTLDQIDYLRNVLGVEQVLVPLPPMTSVRLVVLLPLATDEFPLHGDAEILIEKMIRAMKLELGDVLMVNWNQSTTPLDEALSWVPATAAHCPRLFFGRALGLGTPTPENESGNWFELQGAKALITHSPSELLAQPELKKRTWAHLQQVMKEL